MFSLIVSFQHVPVISLGHYRAVRRQELVYVDLMSSVLTVTDVL